MRLKHKLIIILILVAAARVITYLKPIPGYAEIYYNYAIEALSHKDPPAAKANLHRALFHNPQFAQAHLELGRIYGREGNTQAQLNSYKAAVASGSDDYDALYLVGQEMHKNGSLEEARKLFEKINVVNTHWREPYYRIADIYFEQGRYEEALKYYLMTLEYENTDTTVRYKIGLTLINLNRYGEAMTEYRFLIKLKDKAKARDLLRGIFM